jgi:hypothetical protein
MLVLHSRRRDGLLLRMADEAILHIDGTCSWTSISGRRGSRLLEVTYSMLKTVGVGVLWRLKGSPVAHGS